MYVLLANICPSWLRKCVLWVPILWVCSALLSAPDLQAHGPVSLMVQEALPNDPSAKTFTLQKGVDRIQEPITFGLPFPVDTYFFEIKELALLLNGKIVNNVQYHIERRWPDRRIKWLRIHLQMDLKANQQNKDLLLTSSLLAVNENKLLTEEGAQYVIDTGKAKFWINKKSFRLFDKVEIDGQPLLGATQPGILLTGTDGTVYQAALDDALTITVEDNGPLYVAVVAKGKHVSQEGKDLLDFTVRMHFYKGKQRVKLLYTLRNASKRRLENVPFKSVELVLQSAWEQPSYLVRDHQGESKGQLTKSEKMRLFQGENAFPTIRDKGFDKAHWPTGISGYQLTVDGKELKRGTRDEYIQLFYAQSRAADGRALMAGTRFAAGHWPQGLGVDGDGSVRIGLFPTGNDKPYVIRFGSHITRECVLSFEAKADASPRDEFFRFQYPLVGKPLLPDWYNTEGMLLWRLVSFAEEATFYQQRDWPADDKPDATLNRQPSFAVVRHLDRSTDRPIDQFSQGLLHGFNFLRQESLSAGAYYLMAEQWMNYNADQALHRSDDYDDAAVLTEVPALKGADGKPKAYTALPGAELLPSTSPLWGIHNPHAYGLAFWAFSTGTQRQTRAYSDWGETLKRLSYDDARSMAWRIFNLAQYTDITGIKEHQQMAWEIVQQELLKKRAEPGKSSGIHPLRGYTLPLEQASAKDPLLQTFVQGGPLTWALGLMASHLDISQLQTDQARDLLEATAQFVGQELWYQKSENPGEMGLPATYQPTQTPGDPSQKPDWEGGIQDAYAALYFGYHLTCDKAYLTKGQLLLKASAYNPGNVSWYQDRPGRHMMQYAAQKPELQVFWHPLKLQVKRLGTEATLTWSKPEFATLYWIKYADKKIVDGLGFDPKTRAYQFDPQSHIPFWAATNADGEPNAGDVSPDKPQSMVIKGLDANKEYHFAGRFRSLELCGKTTADRVKESVPEAIVEQDGGPPTETTTESPAEIAMTPGCQCDGSGSKGLPLGLCMLLFLLFVAQKRVAKQGPPTRKS